MRKAFYYVEYSRTGRACPAVYFDEKPFDKARRVLLISLTTENKTYFDEEGTPNWGALASSYPPPAETPNA